MYVRTLIAGGFVLGLASAADANEFADAEPFICATKQAVECGPLGNCVRVPLSLISAPQFVLIDLAAGTIKDGLGEGATESAIENAQLVDDHLILQGIDDGEDKIRDGLGWTLSVAVDTGQMTATAPTQDLAVNLFGACTGLP